MDVKTCFQLNDEYRNVRLAIDKKIKELRSFIVSIEKYKRMHPKNYFLLKFKLPHSIDAVEAFLSEFDEYDPNKRYAFIQRFDGKYLCSQNSERPMTFLARPVPLAWEVFCIEELGEEEEDTSLKIVLKSRGKYVSSENGAKSMSCNRDVIGEWEKFEMVQHHENLYSFKGNNAKFLSCSVKSDKLTCTHPPSDALSENEMFGLEWINDYFDEINRSWKYYQTYLNNLCKDFDKAVEEKKNIDSENFYINAKIEVYDKSDKSNFTFHQQKVFNHKDYKKAIQKADEKIAHVRKIINGENAFLRANTLWYKKSKLDKITKMVDEFTPVIHRLDEKKVSKSFKCNMN